MYHGLFSNGNYKKAFEEAVNELVKHDYSVKARMKLIKELTDAYINETGDLPDPKQLDRLSDYILRDELTDKQPDKVSKTEYPFLSVYQIKRRNKREASKDVNQYSSNGRNTAKAKRPYNKEA
jgi:signal recognition particle GTPase